MPSLPNYLRSERKRAGLSQKDLAYLLGCASGAKASRYERFEREPTLRSALACEAVFGVPISTLFAGLYEAEKQKVVTLARELAHFDATKADDPLAALRREFLLSLYLPQPNDPPKL